MIEENKRVLLGMSGGTDSSVAAMRLLEAGYEVIGVTFRFYELNGSTEYLEEENQSAYRRHWFECRSDGEPCSQ